MLQYSTVEPRTLEILKRLMAMPELKSFYLAGGTALALYRGHRISIDLDLFSAEEFIADELLPVLEQSFSGFTYANPNNPVGLFAFIEDVKVDFVRHGRFRWIAESVLSEGIRLASIEDILAMKIAAILKRGVKKDFWDIAELLSDYSIDDFIAAYNKKYPNQQLLVTIPQAITYFEDAENSADPVSLNGQTWEGVKSVIQDKVKEYLG